MADVKTYKCFPTSIHEVKLNIDSLDKKQMLQYVQLNSKDDDLHCMSFFRPLANKVLEYSEKILKDGDYEFDKIEITNMWGNLLSEGQSHSPHTHSNNILLVFIIYKVEHLFNFLILDQRQQFLNQETHQIGITQE